MAVRLRGTTGLPFAALRAGCGRSIRKAKVVPLVAAGAMTPRATFAAGPIATTAGRTTARQPIVELWESRGRRDEAAPERAPIARGGRVSRVALKDCSSVILTSQVSSSGDTSRSVRSIGRPVRSRERGGSEVEVGGVSLNRAKMPESRAQMGLNRAQMRLNCPKTRLNSPQAKLSRPPIAENRAPTRWDRPQAAEDRAQAPENRRRRPGG